jgi:hypothetical protein
MQVLGTGLLVGVFIACGGSGDTGGGTATRTPVITVTPTDLTTSPSVKPLATESATPSISVITSQPGHFRDGTNGFTFDYPVDWFGPDVPADPSRGYSVILQSYAPGTYPGVDGPPPPQDVKVDVNVEPNPRGHTLEQWATLYETRGGYPILSEIAVTVAGEPAIVRAIDLGFGDPIRVYLFVHAPNKYSVVAYSGGSHLIADYEALVASIRFE